MDCEKFEPLLLDELYEELDELTSAAVKRHVSGCSRCGSILSGMKSTRRAVTLPIVALPADLEDRILAAAREAQKVVPIRSRMSQALSIAGTWAMRPQTAMAAVFLLMMGTSAFLIRSKNYATNDATVSVTVSGTPAPTAPPAPNESLDDKAAAAAHGPTPPNVTRPPPTPAASVALGEDDSAGLVDLLQGQAAGAKSKRQDEGAALGGLGLGGTTTTAREARNTPAPVPTTTAAAAPMNAGPVAGAPGGDFDGTQQPAKPSITKRAGGEQQAQDPFSLGAAAFRARNFAEATKQYDTAAAGGDPNAALWAAESTREGQGCAVALGRFDQVAQKAAGSWIGHEASLRAARCQMAMSQLDPARDRLNKLAQVPSHQQAAQQALTELNQVAARKANGGGAGGAVAAPKRATSPASGTMRAPAESSEQKKPADSTMGF